MAKLKTLKFTSISTFVTSTHQASPHTTKLFTQKHHNRPLSIILQTIITKPLSNVSNLHVTSTVTRNYGILSTEILFKQPPF